MFVSVATGRLIVWIAMKDDHTVGWRLDGTVGRQPQSGFACVKPQAAPKRCQASALQRVVPRLTKGKPSHGALNRGSREPGSKRPVSESDGPSEPDGPRSDFGPPNNGGEAQTSRPLAW